MPDSTLDARIAEARKEADAKWSATCFQGNSPDGTLVGLNDRWLTAFATVLLASERSARAEVEAKLVAAEQERDAYKKLCAEWRQSRDKDRAELTALRSQVASAKREQDALVATMPDALRKGANAGARDALDKALKRVTAIAHQGADRNGEPCYCEHCQAIHAAYDALVGIRDREYPAPATPPERVSVTVQGGYSVERSAWSINPSKPWYIIRKDGVEVFSCCLAAQVGAWFTRQNGPQITDAELRSLLALAGGAE